MNQDNSNVVFEQHMPIQTASPRELLFRYIPYIPWIALSLILSLVFSYIKLRYTPKVYSVTSTLMVKDPSERSTDADKIEELLFSNSNKEIYDEIQVIQTSRMGMRVVRSLGIEVMYHYKGKFITSLIGSDGSPLRMTVLRLKDSSATFSLDVRILDDQTFEHGNAGQHGRFGSPFTTSDGEFVINRTGISLESYPNREFVVSYAPPDARSAELLSRLTVVPLGESNNIMRLNLETEAPTLGEEVLNHWMAQYERAGFDEKKRSTQNALDFINEQLDTANRELVTVENFLLKFRESNMLIDPEAQSQSMISAMTELEKEITERSVQMRLLDNLITYISDNRNPYRQVGTLLNLEEPTLALQITEFNKLQVERATLLPTTPRSNPMMSAIETGIEKLRQDILQNLKNIRQGFQLTLDNLNARNVSANKLVSKMPAKERQLLEITRRQKILEELYQFLLQKKLETSISSASTISSVKVLEPAKSSRIPIRPNRKGTFLLAALIGFGIPVFIAFLIEYLNDKVRSRSDVVRNTRAPIIGEVGHSIDKTTLVVSHSSRKFISEQFKIIRTNLQYVLPSKEKSVILVTSSTSGEGKSFIATNLGAVMALSGKKTAILEFDIRKPKIMSGLGLGKRKGVTNYIIGAVDFESLKVKVPDTENLDVIPCGPIPPNPSELLLDPRMDQFLERLKAEYDVIVIDTAPVGLVSDAMVLGKHADASLYVIRHNYTYKKQMQLMDEIYASRRLPKMSLVLNDIRAQVGGYGGYYGYGGYGYGSYGSSYGKDYFEDDKKKKKKAESFWSRVGSIFSRG